MPNLKVLSKIFSKLLHAETNLRGSNGGMTGLNHILVSITIVLTDRIIGNPLSHLQHPFKKLFHVIKIPLTTFI